MNRLLCSCLAVLLLAACDRPPAPDERATAAQHADAPSAGAATDLPDGAPAVADDTRAAAAPADVETVDVETAAHERGQRLRDRLGPRAEQLLERRRARQDWWDDADIAAELQLRPAQRDAIAARIAEARSTAGRSREHVHAAQQDYRAAIAAGELERAREAARRHAALVSEQALAQRLLVVEVLELMDPAQRATMAAQHRGILLGLADPAGRRAGRLRRAGASADGEGG